MADSCLKAFKFVLSLVIAVLYILCIVWIVKVYHNANDEPGDRLKYYESEDFESVSKYYSEGEFCFDNSQSYLDKGAFEVFDIRMKKIRNFSLALIVTFIISFGLGIINLLTVIISMCCTIAATILRIITCICSILNLVSSILSFIFFIILSVHYFKSNFDDFEDFNDCNYINKNRFDNNYDFVYVVKDNFKRYFIVYIILIVLNIGDTILERIIKKRAKSEE